MRESASSNLHHPQSTSAFPSSPQIKALSLIVFLLPEG
jgi:hypothetical protein